MDRLNQSEQCAVVVMNGNCILGCISKHIASWTEMIIPFYLAYRKPHLTHCAQFWAPHWRESIRGPGIGGEGYEEKLRELYLFIWQMKNLQENLIVVFHYSKGVGDYKEDIVKTVSGVCSRKQEAMVTSCRKRNETYMRAEELKPIKNLLPIAEYKKVLSCYWKPNFWFLTALQERLTTLKTRRLKGR